MSELDAVSPAALVVSVVSQGKGAEIIKAVKESHAIGGMIIFGQGTASQEIWERLGITKEREIVLCTTVYSKVDALMKAITEKFDMKKAGSGIAFALPIDRFLGRGVLKQILQKTKEACADIPELNIEKTDEIKEKVEKMINNVCEEKKKAQETCPMELILIRMANGYAQEVMDTARKAGATGGTIVHGRTSLDSSSIKFFNITIEPESDILFMLISKDNTDNVLNAITNKWGPHTAAHAFGFAVPVLKVFTK